MKLYSMFAALILTLVIVASTLAQCQCGPQCPCPPGVCASGVCYGPPTPVTYYRPVQQVQYVPMYYQPQRVVYYYHPQPVMYYYSPRAAQRPMVCGPNGCK